MQLYGQTTSVRHIGDQLCNNVHIFSYLSDQFTKVHIVNWEYIHCDWYGVIAMTIGILGPWYDYLHIEAETKWPTFSGRHFQMHFLQ